MMLVVDPNESHKASSESFNECFWVERGGGAVRSKGDARHHDSTFDFTQSRACSAQAWASVYLASCGNVRNFWAGDRLESGVPVTDVVQAAHRQE